MKMMLESLVAWHSPGRVHVLLLVIGIAVGILKILDYGNVLYVMGVVCLGIAGAWFGLVYVVCSGKWYSIPYRNVESEAARSFLTKLMNHRAQFRPCKRRMVTTANVDHAIQEILDLVTRDFILSWYQTLGSDHDRFKHLFQDFIWQMMEEFTRRLQQVDFFKFCTQNVVKILMQHFIEIRLARKRTTSNSPKAKLVLHPWLASEAQELEFLRQAAEVFLIHLLPKEYTQCLTVRHMCREILACSIFKPSIDIICDPDYFNEKVLSWLLYRERLAQEHKQTYTYAPTYEDFMRIIRECDDVEHLKHMRYNIISEIMQATTINNLKRAQGIDVDEETVPKGRSKGDLLKARNLKRYINQLTVAKSFCEKRIHTLGGPDYKAPETSHSPAHDIPGKKVLSFSVIMENWGARNCLLTFLMRTEQDTLLRFWLAVESMKQHPKGQWHQLAGDLYQMYITPTSSVVRDNLQRAAVKDMEAFMLGNTGPEAFWEAQAKIFSVLEEKHYPSFILSDLFHQFMMNGEQNWQHVDSSSPRTEESSDEKQDAKKSRSSKKHAKHITAHHTYAQEKLAKLKDKLENKTQALKALKAGQKLDEKNKKIQAEMEKEIQDLKTERQQLEFHIERTEYWAEHIGKWQAQVFNTEVIQEEGKLVPYFILVVHQADSDTVDPQSQATSTRGWVIFRRLAEFHEFHGKLLQILPMLKQKQLPSASKFKAKSVDAAFLAKSKDLIQDFLDVVLEEERLAQSEIMFAFFSPSPEHLKQNPDTSKSKGSSFPGLFKGIPNKSQVDSDSDDDLLFIADEDTITKSKGKKDHVAEPLYQLISEVFELKGMFKWLRKTLMVFVRVTFGQSINKQLRETVHWIYSEPLLVFYLNQYREAYWPGGVMAQKLPPRTTKEQMATRLQAKQALLRNIPDALKNLVGEANGNRGVAKIFEVFQDSRLNKHLFYSLLQEFMLAMCPELQVYQDLIRTMETSKAASSLNTPENHGAEKPL